MEKNLVETLEKTLKPCGFCGELCAGFDYSGDPSQKYGAVICGCGAQGPEVRIEKYGSTDWYPMAAKEWNERPWAIKEWSIYFWRRLCFGKKKFC